MKDFFEKLKNQKIQEINYTKKEHLLIASLSSLTVSFIFLLFGPVDIYANNKQEFAFAFADFVLPLLLIFAGAWLAMSVALIVFRNRRINTVSSVLISAVVAGFIDNVFVNRVTFVSGDAVNTGADKTTISIVLYIAVLVIFLVLSLVLGKRWKNAVAFICVLFVGMNGASLVSDVVSKDLFKDNDIGCDYVLSNKNLFQVSEKENIIYILFDRFDTEYYDAVVKDDPDFYNDLDGFIYYDNATSMYTRTFPGVPYMITGVEYYAQCSANEYLKTSYEASPFLKDLKSNGYNINIYADRYYEYNDAECLKGIADNVEKSTGYTPDKKKIMEYLLKLSFARYSADLLTALSYSNANNGVVGKLSTIESPSGIYHDNDALMYQRIKESGVTFSDNNKNYTFMYFHGCHTPFILDENCEISDKASGLTQAKGSFKLVLEYLNQLREKGVYDNSTIIIAGDHGIPQKESQPLHEQLDKGVRTCIFFKPKNSSHSGLITSSAPASSSNIIPSIVEDAGIETDEDYGKSLLDLKKGDTVERIFYQSVYDMTYHKLGFNKYVISGDAKDINNWKIEESIKSDFPWY